MMSEVNDNFNECNNVMGFKLKNKDHNLNIFVSAVDPPR